MADQPDFASFPVATRGRLFEDFHDGQDLVHRKGRTITAGDNALFTTALCNWNRLHTDAEYARARGHPDVVVNPQLVLCTVVGLTVEDCSEIGGPFLGMDDVRFPAPVHPGDTLTAVSTVVERRTSASNPANGIVTWSTTGRNQHGDVVVSFRRTNLVRRRQRGST